MIKKLLKLSSAIFLSRIFGFTRDIIIGYFLGSGKSSDVFFTSFRITTFFRSLLVHEGSVFGVFVPSCTRLENSSKRKLYYFRNQVMTIFLVFGITITILLEIFAPYIVAIFAKGFDKTSYQNTVQLTRITIPYLFFITSTSILWCFLNAKEKFGYYGYVPIIFNICIISSVFTVGRYVSLEKAMSFGIIVSGICQLTITTIGCYKNQIAIRPRLRYLKKLSVETKSAMKKLFPGLVSSGLTQFNTLVDTVIASFIVGGVSHMYYAERIYFLPYSMIATALSVVALPHISKHGSTGYFTAIQICCILLLPCVCMMLLCPELIVGTLFESGSFIATDTLIVGKIVSLMGIALCFGAVNKVALNVFYAKSDMATPLKINTTSIILNAAASYFFFLRFGIYGIAMGTITSYIFSFVVTHFCLIRFKYIRLINVHKGLLQCFKFICMGLLMVCTILISKNLINFSNTSVKINFILSLVSISALMGTLYLGLLWLFFKRQIWS